jgi:hypothetical protein
MLAQTGAGRLCRQSADRYKIKTILKKRIGNANAYFHNPQLDKI